MATSKASLQDAYLLDEQVGYLLRLANQRHATIFQDRMTAELTPTQFAALARLAQHGKCSQNQLGRHAAMDIATIKGVVDRLKQKGLVTTEPSAEDRRRCLISLSDKGAALLSDLFEQGHEITEATLAPLSPSEQRSFIRLLRKLI